MDDMYQRLGQLLAVIEAAVGFTPTAYKNCLMAPRSQLLGLHLARAMPRILRMPVLNALTEEILQGIDPASLQRLPSATPLVKQGDMQLAYFHQKANLPEIRTAKGPAGVDWTAVDWHKSNAILANELGISRQAVLKARKQHG
ncbi:MAG: hypothetical protein PHV85_00185 [Desulfovibrionaceae bacterium]|nr:hypothetical protein [Desulfovibrionaceae bacterium]